MARTIMRSPQKRSLNRSQQDATDMYMPLAIVVCRCHGDLNLAGAEILISISASRSRGPPASSGASRRGKSGVKSGVKW